MKPPTVADGAVRRSWIAWALAFAWLLLIACVSFTLLQTGGLGVYLAVAVTAMYLLVLLHMARPWLPSSITLPASAGLAVVAGDALGVFGAIAWLLWQVR